MRAMESSAGGGCRPPNRWAARGETGVVLDEMFARADFRHKRFMRFRRFDAKKSVTWPAEQILFGGPGRGKVPSSTR